ncbi:cadherin repeat domain-containing protein [Thalassoglobus neptunius]|nr:cadherin repeat domain-containing protein [Thalassoglobus neptunius]
MLSGTTGGEAAALANNAPTDVRLTSTDIEDSAPDNAIVGILIAVDADIPDSHTFTLVDDAGGRFHINGRTLRVTDSSLIDAQTNSSHTIQIQVTDAAGAQLGTPKEFTIQVLGGANAGPVVANPPGTLEFIQGDFEATYDLSNLFSDPNGDPLTLTVEGSSNPFFFQASIEGSILTVRVADPNLLASVDLTIRAADPSGEFVEHQLTVAVTEPSSTPPIVVNPIDDLNVDQGIQTVVVDLSDVFSDAEDADLNLSVFRNTNSSLIQTSIQGTQLTISFVDPSLLVTGDLTIRATDSSGLFVDETFAVTTIEVVNQPPVVVGTLPMVNVDEDADDVVVDLSGLFSDPEGETLSIAVEGNTNSDLVSTIIVGQELHLQFAENGFGEAQITIRATDSQGDFVEQTLSVVVNAVNDPPVVQSPLDNVNVDEDAPQTVIDLGSLFQDVEDESLTLSVQSLSETGVVETSLDGNQLTLSYLPNQFGVVEVTIRATDSGGEFVDHTFLVTVHSVNDISTVVSSIDDVSVDEGTATSTIDLSGVFSDIETSDLVLTVVGNTNGELVNTALNGSLLTLNYIDGQNGTTEITVRATDADGGFVEETFQVTVNADPDEGDGEEDCHQRNFWKRVRRVIVHVSNVVEEHTGHSLNVRGVYSHIQKSFCKIQKLSRGFSGFRW